MCAISWAQPFQISDSPPPTKATIFASKYHSAFLRVSMLSDRPQHRRRILLKFARNEADITESQNLETEAAGSENASSTSSSFLSVLCPLLKFFGGGDPSRQRNETIEVTTSSLSSLARLPWGSTSLTSSVHSHAFIGSPPKLHVYEFGDIVRYLFQQYGLGSSPSFGLLESTPFTGWVPTLLRAGRGMSLWDKAASEPPPKLIELFSYENNPHARIVREALCELELPYVLHNVGEGSSNTELLLTVSGTKQVPYIVDPNTRVQMANENGI